MKLLKSIVVAFSMYSRIPMPKFDWASDDMKYHLIFFPWVGAVIGALEYLLFWLYGKYEFPNLAFAALAIAIPLLITGGFHLDGFMDTSDAMSSWQTREKRLEILKDPHIGAFSVINVLTAGLLLFASILIMDKSAFIIWCFSFFLARALSGMFVVKGKKAKSDGLLHTEASTASDNIVFYSLLVQAIICGIAACILSPFNGIILLLGVGSVAIGYRRRAYSIFGGITGDLAGWFVVNAEIIAGILLTIRFFVG